MRIHFDEMPENARLWVYQANKPFDDQQEAVIREKLEAFLDQWAAHGAELTTAYEILYQRVLCLSQWTKSQFHLQAVALMLLLESLKS